MSGDESSGGLSSCLHCGGNGTEPFGDEECQICLGEKVVPREVNRQYYEQIREVLDDG